jgi:hypothetical protein
MRSLFHRGRSAILLKVGFNWGASACPVKSFRLGSLPGQIAANRSVEYLKLANLYLTGVANNILTLKLKAGKHGRQRVKSRIFGKHIWKAVFSKCLK